VGGLATGSANVCRNLRNAFFVEVGHANSCTLCCPVNGNRCAHPLSSTGDQSFTSG
jgi:hypothetical protein